MNTIPKRKDTIMAKQFTNLSGTPVELQISVLKTPAELTTRSVLARRTLRKQRRHFRAL